MTQDLKPSATPVTGAGSNAGRVGELYPATLVALGFTCLLFLLFAGGVRVFALNTATGVTALDGRIGEVVAEEARAQWRAGDASAALSLFERALSLPFDDPRQRAWRAEEFGRLLMTGPTYEPSKRFVLMLAPHEPAAARRLMLLLHKRLIAQGRTVDALDCARHWRQALASAERPALQAHAFLLEGHALREAGRLAEAADRYRAAHEVEPTATHALAAARALLDLGRTADAGPLLAYVEAEGSMEQRNEAASLRGAAQGPDPRGGLTHDT